MSTKVTTRSPWRIETYFAWCLLGEVLMLAKAFALF